MNDSETHTPSPEFRARLEWQIESALRRESRFTRPVASGGRLRTALALLITLAIGGVAGVASGQVDDARRRQLLIASAMSEQQLAEVRFDLARERFQKAQAQFETGLLGRQSLREAESELRAMETELARSRIDIEEIEATSATPNNELTAPLVGGRDFVRERLELELEAAQRELAGAQQRNAAVERQFRIGTATRLTQLQAMAELEHARHDMMVLTMQLELRRRFLSGDVAAARVAPEMRRNELQLQAEHAEHEIEIVRQRVEDLRALLETGRVREIELKRAEVELLEREVMIQQIRSELALIGG